MFDTQLKEYVSLLESKFGSMNDKIVFNDVLDNENIPDSIKKFFQNESNRWLNKNELDQDNKELSINEQAFKRLLNKSVESRYNFLIRPRASLIRFIFGDEDSESIHNVSEILNYFSDYSYLLTAISSELDGIHSSEISKNDFTELVNSQDNDHVFNLDQDEIVSLLDPIFDLFTFDGFKPEGTTPAEALIVFFSDKGVDSVVDRISSYIEEKGVDNFTKDSFSNFFLNIDPDADISVESELDTEDGISVDDADSSNSDFDFDQEDDSIEDIIEEENEEILNDISDQIEVEETNINDSKPEDGEDIASELLNEVEDLPDTEFESTIDDDIDVMGELSKELGAFDEMDDGIIEDSSNESNEASNDEPEIEADSEEESVEYSDVELDEELSGIESHFENTKQNDDFVSAEEYQSEDGDILSELQVEMNEVTKDLPE